MRPSASWCCGRGPFSTLVLLLGLLLTFTEGFVIPSPQGHPSHHVSRTPLVSRPLQQRRGPLPSSHVEWSRPASSYILDPTGDAPSPVSGGEVVIPHSNTAAVAGSSTRASPSNKNALEMIMELVTSLRAKKLYVWLGFFGLAWKLKTFYGLILGTFVLSYIGSTLVRWCERRGNEALQYLKLPRLPRRIWASAYIATVLSVITTLTVLSVPRVVGETNYLSLVIESENPYVFVADGIRELLGPEAMSNLEAFLLTVTGEEGRNFAAGVIAAQGAAAAVESTPGKVVRMMPKVKVDGVWTAERASRFAKLLEFSLKGYVKSAFQLCRTLLTQSTSVVYKGILSLLFSSMIIFDLPKLTSGVRKLKYSKLGFAYNVMAPKFASFGKMVGQSFEAQSIIAVVNTILTTTGLIALKIPGYGAMSILVLMTSFIPVFGVVLSTLPMALVALTEYGLSRAIDVIFMVIGVHCVEAYCLSPLIYSATVKLHPVVIITALYVTEHLVGLQGVFLAVPAAMFLIMQIFEEANLKPMSKKRQQQSELPQPA